MAKIELNKLCKLICIKEYKDKNLHFKIGDFASVILYNNGNLYISIYTPLLLGCDVEKAGAIPMYPVKKETLDNFITLAEWRERQIDSILDGDD